MTADSSLGAYLRAAREAKGVSLEQVASGTRISIKTLRLLEADDFEHLPARPFIRGFVSAYCRFLGQDAQEILTRYGEFLEEKSRTRPVRDQGHSGYAFERPEGENSRRTLWIAMGTILILGAVGSVVLKPMLKRHKKTPIERVREGVAPTETVLLASPSPSHSVNIAAVLAPAPSPTPTLTQTPTPTPSPSPKAPSPTPTPSPSPKAPSPTPSPTPTPTQTVVAASPTPSPSVSRRADPLSSGLDLLPSEVKYKVIFRMLDDVWVRFRVDAKPPNRFVVRKDRVLVLKAQERIRFQASNPDAIRVTFGNGKSSPFKDLPGIQMLAGDPTLFVPPLKAGEEDPSPLSPKTGKLLGAPVPQGRGSTSGSTPSSNSSDSSED